MDEVGSRLQSFKQFVLPESQSEVVEKSTAPVVPPYLKNAKEFSDKGLSQRVNKTIEWVHNSACSNTKVLQSRIFSTDLFQVSCFRRIDGFHCVTPYASASFFSLTRAPTPRSTSEFRQSQVVSCRHWSKSPSGNIFAGILKFILQFFCRTFMVSQSVSVEISSKV